MEEETRQVNKETRLEKQETRQVNKVTETAGKQRKDRIRDYGFIPGRIRTGKNNSITDVPGVKVGHWTLKDEKHNTGVTVILPREEIYQHKCTAAAHVINGYGKSAGLLQIMELGQLETPIALTDTLNVGMVSDALVQYSIEEEESHGRTLTSVNPVVGECNDSRLNTITDRVAGYEQVMEAIHSASETFEQGCAGAGAGMTCHGLKGGIGSASRVVTFGGREYTVGVLTLCNHGKIYELNILGNKIGPEVTRRVEARQAEEESREGQRHNHADKSRVCAAGEASGMAGKNTFDLAGMDEDRGSCMIILATDIPLSSRQLLRVIKRTGVGLARCGSYWGHNSGDFAIGFTTAHDICEAESEDIVMMPMLREEKIDDVFAAAAEATEEAVLNCLTAADTTTGPSGLTRYCLREFEDLLMKSP